MESHPAPAKECESDAELNSESGCTYVQLSLVAPQVLNSVAGATLYSSSYAAFGSALRYDSQPRSIDRPRTARSMRFSLRSSSTDQGGNEAFPPQLPSKLKPVNVVRSASRVTFRNSLMRPSEYDCASRRTNISPTVVCPQS